MKISTKGRYGLRALIDLALHSRGTCVSLSDISARQELSLNYLESIFAYLKKSGLVIGVAGAQGGYLLAKPAEQITLLEVLTALEGDLSVYDHIGAEPPIRAFLNRNVWDAIDRSITDVLKNTSLADLLEELHTDAT
ncbi:MAG: Rrf2 family transcriptional regulator [Clostridiales bacterium]|jgi:Rrf2 family protein|nr:Rrf2 family transcriptional regulator [Clostridiales bacterium]